MNREIPQKVARRRLVIATLASIVVAPWGCAAAQEAAKRPAAPILRVGSQVAAVRADAMSLAERLSALAKRDGMDGAALRRLARSLATVAEDLGTLAAQLDAPDLDRKALENASSKLRAVTAQVEKRKRAFDGLTDAAPLTTDISQSVDEMNRLGAMFSNILNKLNESQMALIRNL